MNLSDNFLRELFPINISESYSQKKLAIDLFFFKVTSSFPKEEIMQMKKFQVESEKSKLSNLLISKSWNQLDTNEKNEIFKIAKKRASTPIKTTHYLRFLVKSILLSVTENNYKGVDKDEPIFKINNEPYYCTLNRFKNDPNSIVFNEIELFDSKDLFCEDVVLKICQKLPLNLNTDRVNQINNQLNEIRSMYISLYNHEVSVKKEFMPMIQEMVTKPQFSEKVQKD